MESIQEQNKNELSKRKERSKTNAVNNGDNIENNEDNAAVQNIQQHLANECTSILNDPENNIKKISEILKIKEHKGLIYLSLVKVFKNIVPLYKIRVHSNKVKHRNQEMSVTDFDRILLQQYNAFIKEICSSDEIESYKAAAELIRCLDHFNFADRLISKVLIGTTKQHAVGKFCIESLVDRVKNDPIGETIFMILDKCLDYKFSHQILKAIIDSKYLESCVQIRIAKETFYQKEKIEERKLNKREKAGKGFFKKNFLKAKAEKKEEKKRLQQMKQVRMQEETELSAINEKNYIRTVNALQRLYFTVLKTQNEPCYESTFIGVRKYIKIIRKEFHEGLYTLMIEAIRKSSVNACLEGMLTIHQIYKDCGYDFKRILDSLFALISPFNFNFNQEHFEFFSKVIKLYFVETIQPKVRVFAFIQRLILARCVRLVPQFALLIKNLEVKYDLDINDHDYKNRMVNNLETEDVDRITFKPLYEYYLFKKLQ